LVVLSSYNFVLYELSYIPVPVLLPYNPTNPTMETQEEPLEETFLSLLLRLLQSIHMVYFENLAESILLLIHDLNLPLPAYELLELIS